MGSGHRLGESSDEDSSSERSSTPPASPGHDWSLVDEAEAEPTTPKGDAAIVLEQAREDLRARPRLGKVVPSPPRKGAASSSRPASRVTKPDSSSRRRARKSALNVRDFNELKSYFYSNLQAYDQLATKYRALKRAFKMKDEALRALQAKIPELAGIVDEAVKIDKTGTRLEETSDDEGLYSPSSPSFSDDDEEMGSDLGPEEVVRPTGEDQVARYGNSIHGPNGSFFK